MTEQSISHGRINRRDILKAIGVSASVATMGTNKAASHFDSVANVDVVHVATTFSYDTTTKSRKFHREGVSSQVVDTKMNTLFLPEWTTAAEKSVVESHPVVTNIGGLSSLPAATKTDSVKMVPIGVNDFTYEPDLFLGVHGGLQVPSVSIQMDGASPIVTSNGLSTELDPNSEQTFDVDTHTVTASAYEVLEGQLVDAPHIPEEERSVKMDRWEEEVELTRKIQTRYLTDVSVVDLENQ